MKVINWHSQKQLNLFSKVSVFTVVQCSIWATNDLGLGSNNINLLEIKYCIVYCVLFLHKYC